MNHAQLRISKLSLGLMAAFAMPAFAQSADTTAEQAAPKKHVDASTTSNTTTANDTQRNVQQLDAIHVKGTDLSLGGGLMSVQTAAKAVSTITREAITQAAPGATFVQMIDTIPGVVAQTDDVTGLNNGNYQIRGFTSDEIGITVNGAPINDSGNYAVYSTEYGDTENMGDITVLQGYPDVDSPVAGAAGGTIAWATINPDHDFGVDASFSGGSHDYRREFVRVQTGDTGPVRSWISYSHNEADVWRGSGNMAVDKIDGKSIWTINDENSISASFQYNREKNYYYGKYSKAVFANDYYTNYDDTLGSGTSTSCTKQNSGNGACYYGMHINPFKSYMVSLDGEFQLTDSLHLSVVPYFQYGSGGGGSGAIFTESSSAANEGRIKYTDQDLNGDGVVGGKALVYQANMSYTWRPGVIAKLIQDLGPNDSLEYGFWLDDPRQEQYEGYTNQTDGTPSDVWFEHKSNWLKYADGTPQLLFNEYTQSKLRKFFATNTWTPTDALTITAGAAYTWEKREGWDYQNYGATAGSDYQQQFGGEVSGTWHKVTPTAGIKYQIDDQNQLYLGWGRTFRAPVNGALMQNGAALIYYSEHPDEVGYGTYQITPENLAELKKGNKPETSDTVDLGWRYYGNRVSASADVYAANLKNKQLSAYDEDTGSTAYMSLDGVHQRGFNAEASWKIIDSLTLYGSYSYTRSIIQGAANFFSDGVYQTDGKSFVNAPKNVLHARLTYNQGPFWASLDANYRSSFWADWMNTESAPGYTTMNLSAGWKFPDISSEFRKPAIKLNVYNLTDKHALAFASATNPLATEDANDDYYSTATYNVLEPRTVMVTFSASFF